MNQLRHIQIYNLSACILLVCVYLCCGLPSYSVEYGSINKEVSSVNYSSIDIDAILKKADLYYSLAQKEQDEDLKSEYLKKAEYEYNIVCKAKYDDIYSAIQLGRIYDYQKQDRYAKSYFSRALGLNYRNPYANYYMANFYYDRKDYKKALKFYRKAMDYGIPEDIELLSKMGEIFEKFGDLKRASICYKRAFLIDPSNEDIPDKIREMEEIDYSSAGYYNRRSTR